MKLKYSTEAQIRQMIEGDRVVVNKLGSVYLWYGDDPRYLVFAYGFKVKKLKRHA